MASANTPRGKQAEGHRRVRRRPVARKRVGEMRERADSAALVDRVRALGFFRVWWKLLENFEQQCNSS